MLSVDLDDHWSYLRSFGRQQWQAYPSFLGSALPRILDTMSEHELDITIFAVGIDAQRDSNREPLMALASAGYEFANHSWHHDPTVFAGPRDKIENDLQQAELALERICGTRPRGFRGPAYLTSETLFEVLKARGYAYDASSFPMSLTALSTLYQRLHPGGSPNNDRSSDAKLSSAPFLHAWSTLQPHSIANGTMMELPVTTLPLLRFPIHFTYLNALGDVSEKLALWYFRLALNLCALRSIPPSILLHAADFIGADDPCEMNFLPGMRSTWQQKRRRLNRLLGELSARYRVCGLKNYLLERGA